MKNRTNHAKISFLTNRYGLSILQINLVLGEKGWPTNLWLCSRPWKTSQKKSEPHPKSRAFPLVTRLFSQRNSLSLMTGITCNTPIIGAKLTWRTFTPCWSLENWSLQWLANFAFARCALWLLFTINSSVSLARVKTYKSTLCLSFHVSFGLSTWGDVTATS